MADFVFTLIVNTLVCLAIIAGLACLAMRFPRAPAVLLCMVIDMELVDTYSIYHQYSVSDALSRLAGYTVLMTVFLWIAGKITKKETDFILSSDIVQNSPVQFKTDKKWKIIAHQLLMSYFILLLMQSAFFIIFKPDDFSFVWLHMMVVYISARLAAKKNRKICNSYYEPERKKIQEQQEQARQAEMLRQEQARAAERQRQEQAREAERQRQEAERQRQEQIREAERQRQAQAEALERGKEEVRREFVERIIYRYPVRAELRQVMSGQYSKYDIRTQIEENENTAFFYSGLCVQPPSQQPMKQIWVSNDERISVMNSILADSGVCDFISPSLLQEKSSPLFALASVDAPLPPVKREFSIYKILNPLYEALSQYINMKIEEFNTMIACRTEQYMVEYKIMRAGLDGEDAVQEVLDMHEGAFLVLHNLRLEFQNKNGETDSVETDTFVMAPYGLFAIETKNYGASGSYRIVVSGDGNWYREYPSRYPNQAVKREKMDNPFAQNDRHIAFLERFVNEVLGRDMMHYAHVRNIIVLANDNVEIVNDPSARQTLTRVGNLYNQLTQDTTPQFTFEELKRIESALEESTLPPRKYPLNDYQEELSSLMLAYQSLREFPTKMRNWERQLLIKEPRMLQRVCQFP